MSDQEKLVMTGSRLAEIELAVDKGQFTNGFERELLAEVMRLRGIPAEPPAAPDADQAAYAKECVPEDGRMTTMRGAAPPTSDPICTCPSYYDKGSMVGDFCQIHGIEASERTETSDPIEEMAGKAAEEWIPTTSHFPLADATRSALAAIIARHYRDLLATLVEEDNQLRAELQKCQPTPSIEIGGTKP